MQGKGWVEAKDIGFIQSKSLFFCKKKGNRLLIDENWKDILFPATVEFIKNIEPSCSINKSPNF